MAIEQKERYVISLVDGRVVNAVCQSFRECIDLYGEENVISIRKMDYNEPVQGKEV